MVVITREIMDAVSFLMGGNGEAAQGVSDDNVAREAMVCFCDAVNGSNIERLKHVSLMGPEGLLSPCKFQNWPVDIQHTI
jgi:hypothetical protein